MSVTITVPQLNGDGSLATFSLQLPSPFVGGVVTWSSGTSAHGTVTPSNDGLSALFTPGTAGSTTITATVTQGPLGLSVGWQPGHLYRLNDQIVDQNGKVQKVTTATGKQVQTVYTPNAGAVSNSPSILLSGGSAASTTHGVVNITGISATVPTTWQVGDSITIANATSPTMDGLWVISFLGANAVSFTGYTGGTLSSVSQTAGAIINTSKGGDASIFSQEGSGADNSNTSSILGQSGDFQYGTVLNSDGGGANGDWPAGAIAANSGNILNPYPTTAAAVTWVAAGYSSGKNSAGVDNGPAGIDSPEPIVPWSQNSPYSVGFRIVDENGNIQKVRLAGTSGTQYPTFSTSSTTIDGTVTWVYVSAAVQGYTNSTTYLHNATFSEVGPDQGTFPITSVVTTVSGSGVAVYHGTFPATANALAGYAFVITGFATNVSNNGNFICTASTSTTLTLTNAAAVSETITALANNKSQRAYIDAAGNIRVGWLNQAGTVEFAESVGIPPAFASSGTTIDGDLIWTEQSTASLTTVYNNVTLTVSTSAGIIAVPYNYLVIS